MPTPGPPGPPSRGETMKRERREFLKQAGIAGAASMAAGCSTPGMMQASDAKPRKLASGPMPRNLVLLSMMDGGEAALGVKTDRGVLDVRRAAAQYGKTVPLTMDELVRHGDNGL